MSTYIYLAAESLSPLARLLRWSAGLLLLLAGEWTLFPPAKKDPQIRQITKSPQIRQIIILFPQIRQIISSHRSDRSSYSHTSDRQIIRFPQIRQISRFPQIRPIIRFPQIRQIRQIPTDQTDHDTPLWPSV